MQRSTNPLDGREGRPGGVDEWSSGGGSHDDYDDEEEEDEDEEEEESDEEESSDSQEGSSLLSEHSGGDGFFKGNRRFETWFLTSAKTSFFIGSLLCLVASIATAATCLHSLDTYYQNVIDGVNLVREYDSWVDLETELFVLDTVAPAFALTNDGTLSSMMQEQVEVVIGQTEALISISDNNVSLGFSVEASIDEARDDLSSRLTTTSTQHALLANQKSTRSSILLLHAPVSFFQRSEEGYFSLPHDGSYKYIHIVQDLGGTMSQLLHSFQRAYSLMKSTEMGSGSANSNVTTLLENLYQNISRITMLVTEDLFAVESFYAHTPSALDALTLVHRVSGNYHHESIVNDTVLGIEELSATVREASAIVANSSRSDNLTVLLRREQIQLLNLYTQSAADLLIVNGLALRRAFLGARALFRYQRDAFVHSSAQTREFADIGSIVTKTLGDETGLRSLVRDLETQRLPVQRSRELTALQKAEELLLVNEAGETGLRNIRIVAATTISPFLLYVLYAVVGVNAELRRSFLPYRFFILATVLLVVALAGILGGVAGKTINVITTRQNLVSTIHQVEEIEHRIVEIGDAQRKFSEFLRHPERPVELPIKYPETSYSQIIVDLLEKTGQVRLEEQFHENVLIAEAFNKSHGRVSTSYHPYQSLTYHWDDDNTTVVDPHPDCQALIGAAAYLMLVPAYGLTSGDQVILSDIKTHIHSVVSLADSASPLCHPHGPPISQKLWTDFDAPPQALHLTVTEPTRSILHFLSVFDGESSSKLSSAIVDHIAELHRLSSQAKALIESQGAPLEQQREKDRRLLVWTSILTLLGSQLMAWLIAHSLFDNENFLR